MAAGPRSSPRPPMYVVESLGQVVAHEGVEVAAIPVDGGAREHRPGARRERHFATAPHPWDDSGTQRARARRGEHQTADGRSAACAPAARRYFFFLAGGFALLPAGLER